MGYALKVHAPSLQFSVNHQRWFTETTNPKRCVFDAPGRNCNFLLDDFIIQQKNNKMGYALKVHAPSLQFSMNRLWRFTENKQVD
jgi:hypothetical protein